MVALSTFTTLSVPPKTAFLMKSVRSLAPDSSNSLSNFAFSAAFRRKLYL